MKVRTEARRGAILEVASQVFLEYGYDRASMSEIVKRLGGSKSTLYGYFESKEDLFLAVAQATGEQHMAAALAEIAEYAGGDLEAVLIRFAEKLISFLTSAEAVAAHRMVVGAAADSGIGRLYYEAGPQKGLAAMAGLFKRAMDLGELSAEDPWLVAGDFHSLTSAEHQFPRLFDPAIPPLSRAQVKGSARRTVSAFLRAYAPDKQVSPLSGKDVRRRASRS